MTKARDEQIATPYIGFAQVECQPRVPGQSVNQIGFIHSDFVGGQPRSRYATCAPQAQAARITYEIEYRFDYRRKILGGELPPLTAEDFRSDYHRWLNPDPRARPGPMVIRRPGLTPDA